MKKKRNKSISMIIVFALILSTFQVQYISAGELKDAEIVETEQPEEEPAQNQQSETEQPVEETENQQTEEQQPEDGEKPSNEPEEDVPVVTSEEEDPFLAEREDKANSWRYIDGEWIQEEHNSKSRAFKQFSTWPNVTGAVAKGIDVSEHNGVIDWAKAKKAGVDYAIIRCGYGMNLTGQDDKQWLNNIKGCEQNGIPFGVYLYSYADSIERASSEAQHVLRLVSGHKLAFPIFYDLEEYAIRDKLSTSEIAAIAQTFCDVISKAGYDVGIYSNTDWFSNYLTDVRFNQWKKWVAQYYSSCTYKGEYQMWQCSSEGQVDGINGNVDLNISYSRFNTENKANIAKGTYIISSGIDNSKLLSVRNASHDERANIAVWNNSNIVSTQRFEITGIGSGFYKIAVEGTGKVLDIAGGSSKAGVEIIQNSWNGAESQKWCFVDAGNGYYYIQSKLGTYLNLKDADTADGNAVQTASWSDSPAQKWKLSVSDYHPLADGIYTFSAGLNQKKVLDVKYAYMTDGANVQVYDTNQSPAQQFSLTYVGKGYYKIAAKHSSKVLDVANASQNPGANVQQVEVSKRSAGY